MILFSGTGLPGFMLCPDESGVILCPDPENDSGKGLSGFCKWILSIVVVSAAIWAYAFFFHIL